MLFHFYYLYSHELNKGEPLSKILLYELEHITKKGGKCVIIMSFHSRISWDQRRSKTPQFVTTKMGIRGLHSPKVTATFNILNYTPLHLKSPIEMII
jgi:hypothetical protein